MIQPRNCVRATLFLSSSPSQREQHLVSINLVSVCVYFFFLPLHCESCNEYAAHCFVIEIRIHQTWLSSFKTRVTLISSCVVSLLHESLFNLWFPLPKRANFRGVMRIYQHKPFSFLCAVCFKSKAVIPSSIYPIGT